MVLGHQIAHHVGIGPKAEGALAEQFLHAEATNLQLGAGMALGHAVTGGRLQAMERGLDISLSLFPSPRVGEGARRAGEGENFAPFATATAGGPKISKALETERPLILPMSGKTQGMREGGGKPPTNSNYQPTIIGIAHNDSEEEKAFIQTTLEEAHDRGARTVGLELSRGDLSSKIADPKSTFIQIANFARGLGMEVIPLEGDPNSEKRWIVNLGKSFIHPTGRFDKALLEEKIQELEIEVMIEGRRDRSHIRPEGRLNLEIYQKKIADLKELRSMLEDLHWDLDNYSKAWHQTVIVKTNEEMQESIRALKPDIVFVGQGHSQDFSESLGYILLDGALLDAKTETLAASMKSFPHLRKMAEWLTTGTDFVLQALKGFCEDLLETKNLSQNDFYPLLERALQIEPHLKQLIFRAFYEEGGIGFLAPHEDTEFLKLGIPEAKKRIERVLHLAKDSQILGGSGKNDDGGPLASDLKGGPDPLLIHQHFLKEADFVLKTAESYEKLSDVDRLWATGALAYALTRLGLERKGAELFERARQLIDHSQDPGSPLALELLRAHDVIKNFRDGTWPSWQVEEWPAWREAELLLYTGQWEKALRSMFKVGPNPADQALFLARMVRHVLHKDPLLSHRIFLTRAQELTQKIEADSSLDPADKSDLLPLLERVPQALEFEAEAGKLFQESREIISRKTDDTALITYRLVRNIWESHSKFKEQRSRAEEHYEVASIDVKAPHGLLLPYLRELSPNGELWEVKSVQGNFITLGQGRRIDSEKRVVELSGDRVFKIIGKSSQVGPLRTGESVAFLPAVRGGSGGKDDDKPTRPFHQISSEEKQRLIEVYQEHPDVKVILDGSGWTLEEKRDLIDLLSKRAGNLEEALMNLPTALRSLQNAGWAQDMQMALLTILAAKARTQVHRAYQKIPHLIESLQRKFWEVEEQYRLLAVMADRSGMHVDEAYEKLLPALEALEITNWSLKNKYRFFHFLVERVGSVVAPSLENLPHTLSELKEMGWGFHQNFQFFSFLIINAGHRPPFVRDPGIRRIIHFNPLQRASRPPVDLQPWREYYPVRSIDDREPSQGLVLPIRSAQSFPVRVELWDVKYVDGDKLILTNGEETKKNNLRQPLQGQRVVKNIQGTYFPLQEGDRVVFWPRPKGNPGGSWWKKIFGRSSHAPSLEKNQKKTALTPTDLAFLQTWKLKPMVTKEQVNLAGEILAGKSGIHPVFIHGLSYFLSDLPENRPPKKSPPSLEASKDPDNPYRSSGIPKISEDFIEHLVKRIEENSSDPEEAVQTFTQLIKGSHLKDPMNLKALLDAIVNSKTDPSIKATLCAQAAVLFHARGLGKLLTTLQAIGVSKADPNSKVYALFDLTQNPHFRDWAGCNYIFDAIRFSRAGSKLVAEKLAEMEAMLDQAWRLYKDALRPGPPKDLVPFQETFYEVVDEQSFIPGLLLPSKNPEELLPGREELWELSAYDMNFERSVLRVTLRNGRKRNPDGSFGTIPGEKILKTYLGKNDGEKKEVFPFNVGDQVIFKYTIHGGSGDIKLSPFSVRALAKRATHEPEAVRRLFGLFKNGNQAAARALRYVDCRHYIDRAETDAEAVEILNDFRLAGNYLADAKLRYLDVGHFSKAAYFDPPSVFALESLVEAENLGAKEVLETLDMYEHIRQASEGSFLAAKALYVSAKSGNLEARRGLIRAANKNPDAHEFLQRLGIPPAPDSSRHTGKK